MSDRGEKLDDMVDAESFPLYLYPFAWLMWVDVVIGDMCLTKDICSPDHLCVSLNSGKLYGNTLFHEAALMFCLYKHCL